MLELVKEAGNEGDAISTHSSQPVLQSSIKLFQYIKTSIKRCVALNNGQTFFGLHKAYKKALVGRLSFTLSNLLYKSVELNWGRTVSLEQTLSESAEPENVTLSFLTP